MLNEKTAVGALIQEFVPLAIIVTVAVVLQRLTHYAFHGTK